MTETTLEDLQSQIMNLPAINTTNYNATHIELAYYKKGHRDARHAAAELVAAFGTPVSNVKDERNKRYSHPVYGTGHIGKDRSPTMGTVLLHLDEHRTGYLGPFCVEKKRLTEIPEVDSVSDSFEPDEAKYLNYISGALDLPGMNEYQSKAHLLADIYSRICEAGSCATQAASALGFVSNVSTVHK